MTKATISQKVENIIPQIVQLLIEEGAPKKGRPVKGSVKRRVVLAKVWSTLQEASKNLKNVDL